MDQTADALSTLQLREVVDEDAMGLSVLLGELGYPTSPEEALQRVRQHRQSGEGRLIAVTLGEELTAFASIHLVPLVHHAHPLCRISAFVVSSRARRRGVGRRLIEEIENYARAMGCTRVEVTSNERRKDAHQFYQSLGYVQASVRFLKNL